MPVASSQDNILVAVDPTEPWVIKEDGKPNRGINIEITEHIAKALGRNHEIVLCPWARCLNMLEKGSVDMMVNIFHSKEREERLYFVEPNIMEDPPKRFYLNKRRNLVINDYEDLYKMTVGHVRGAFYFAKFDNDDRLIRFPMAEEKQLINLLLNDRIDTFIGTEVTVDFLLHKFGKKDLFEKAHYRWQSGRKTYIAVSRKSTLMESPDKLSQTVVLLKSKGVFIDIATRIIQ